MYGDMSASPFDFAHHICLIPMPYFYHRRLYLTRLPIHLKEKTEKMKKKPLKMKYQEVLYQNSLVL